MTEPRTFPAVLRHDHFYLETKSGDFPAGTVGTVIALPSQPPHTQLFWLFQPQGMEEQFAVKSDSFLELVYVSDFAVVGGMIKDV